MMKAQFEAAIGAIEKELDAGEGYWIKVRTIGGQELVGAHMMVPTAVLPLIAIERPKTETSPRSVQFVDVAAIESLELYE